MSAAPSGVAATPKYPRDHTKLPMIGHRLSADATAIAVVTISPGAMYATYDTPPSTPVEVGVRSTSAPPATPSPNRYISGCTNEASMLLTQNRRNTVACQNATRTGPGVDNAIVSPPACDRSDARTRLRGWSG